MSQSKDRATFAVTENKLVRTWKTYPRIKANFILMVVLMFDDEKLTRFCDCWCFEKHLPRDRLRRHSPMSEREGLGQTR